MSWNQLTLDVPDDLKDAIVGELSFEGVSGIWEEGQPRPGHTRLVVYFNSPSDLKSIETCVATIFARTGLEAPLISKEMVEECDWTEEWKKSYTSFEIGNDFFVIPSWEHVPAPTIGCPSVSIRGKRSGRELTRRRSSPWKPWNDGLSPPRSFSISEQVRAFWQSHRGYWERARCSAVISIRSQYRSLSANIVRNAENEIWTFCGSANAIRTGSVHLVLCNMTADLITELLSEIDRVLRPQGIAIFSGILREQHEELSEVIARHRFTVHEELTRGEWVALIAEKHVA